MDRSLLAGAALLLAGTGAEAETSPFRAFTQAVNGGSVAGCLASFRAPDTPFMDIGQNLGAPDRKDWFCNAVVEAGGNYTILEETREGDVIVFTVDFRAGSYFLEARGRAVVDGDRIADLVIERR